MEQTKPDPILNSLLETVLKDSFTSNQALKRLRLLKDTLSKQLFTEKDPTLSSVADATQTAWLRSLQPDFLKQFNRSNLSPLFIEAESKIKTITPLTIVLPFELPEKETTELGLKLRQQYGKYFLMEIKFDASLIAGPALVWKGVYKDYSLKAKIEARKTEILQILKGSIRR